jgi:hypothetical protein
MTHLFKICYEDTQGHAHPTQEEAIIHSILAESSVYLHDYQKKAIADAFTKYAYIIERKQSEVIPTSQSSSLPETESLDSTIRPTEDWEDSPSRNGSPV